MLKSYTAAAVLTLLLSAWSVLFGGCAGDSTPAAPEISPSGPSSALTQPVATSALPGPTTTARVKLSPEEIAVNSFSALQKMTCLKFDMELSMSLTLPAGKETGTMKMLQSATSAINIPDKQMDMVMDMVMEVPNQDRQDMSAEIYSVDGWLYIRAEVPGISDQWTKMKLTDEQWARQSQLASMTDFLKAPTGLELIGSEKVGGVDCYVLSITPDVKSLATWMAGQMQSGQTGMDFSNTDFSKLLQSFMVKEWIAKDSYLLARQQIGLKLNLNSPEATGSATTQTNMDMNATLTYYDYGKPVVIQLPPEALEAKEIKLTQ